MEKRVTFVGMDAHKVAIKLASVKCAQRSSAYPLLGGSPFLAGASLKGLLAYTTLVVDGGSFMACRRKQVGHLYGEVLVDLESHPKSLWHGKDAFARQLCCIRNRRVNRLLG